MRRYAVLLGLLLATPAAADCPSGALLTADGCATPEAVRAKIDAIVAEAMAAHRLKATLAGYAFDGAAELTAAGESMTGVPATPDMRFRNGAVAIAYLGTLLLQEAEKGTVRLDQPLATWFPDYPAAGDVTLEMLINGTSGYANYVTDEGFLRDLLADPFRAWTPEELIAIGLARPQACAPGACWSYAHTNFVILGRVLEAATGRPLEALIRERIIEPLALSGTQSDVTPAIPEPALHAFDAERGTYEESTYWSPSWTLAHGAIMTSTVADLLASAAAIGEGTLLSPASHERQLAPATAHFPPWDERMWYGLGVFVIDGWIVQNPSFSGYAAAMAYLPARRLALAVSVTFAPGATEQNPSTDVLKAIAAYLAPEAPLR
jgi:CubicO group peptidase (beta-lactamase class C family)